MTRITICLIAPVAVLLATFIAPSFAQDTRGLIDRIDQLTRKLNDLDRHIYRGTIPPASAPNQNASPDTVRAANIEIRLQQLNDEFRSLTGSVEKLAHDVRILNDRVEKLVADVDFRLSAIERAGTVSPAAPPQGSPNVSPVLVPPEADQPANPPVTQQFTSLPAGTAKERYDHAKKLLFERRWDEVEFALQQFIDEHPDHVLVSNAYYWLGETHYVRKDYDRSAIIFADGYKKLPQGNKAPDILLKLGLSLVSLGRNEDACLTFEELSRLFPNVPNAFKQQADKAKQKADCA